MMKLLQGGQRGGAEGQGEVGVRVVQPRPRSTEAGRLLLQHNAAGGTCCQEGNAVKLAKQADKQTGGQGSRSERSKGQCGVSRTPRSGPRCASSCCC